MRTDLILDQADDLLRQGDARRAVSLLGPLVGDQPGNAGAWHRLARARLDLGVPGHALDAAREALRLDPGDTESLYWVSAAYSALGRHRLALAASAAARDEDPLDPRLAERHGRALLAAGRHEEAEHHLRTALEFASYDAALHVAHGVALFATGRPLSAREAFGRAVAIEPAHPGARAELRTLAGAERRIVDAPSLLRVCDAYAEALRVPAGGRTPTGPRAGLAHVATVLTVVCLAALFAVGFLTGAAGAHAPAALTVALFATAGGAACLAFALRPRRGR